jgi:hypothetical protein
MVHCRRRRRLTPRVELRANQQKRAQRTIGLAGGRYHNAGTEASHFVGSVSSLDSIAGIPRFVKSS